jgi:hypothetical protein
MMLTPSARKWRFPHERFHHLRLRRLVLHHLPDPTVITFTREQAGRELQTPVLSIKPAGSCSSPSRPSSHWYSNGTGHSHAPNTLPPIATLSPTSTSPSPAHEPECMSIDRTQSRSAYPQAQSAPRGKFVEVMNPTEPSNCTEPSS